MKSIYLSKLRPSIILLFFVWSLAIFCYAFLLVLETFGFKSVEIDKTDSYLFMFLCLSLLFLGLILGNSGRLGLRRSQQLHLDIYSLDSVGIINSLCFIGFVAGIVSFAAAGGVSADLETQRALHTSGELDTRGGLSAYISLFGSAFGIIGVSLIPWTRQHGVQKTLFSILPVFGSLLRALVTGGRISVLIFCLPLILSFFVKHQKLIFLKYKLKFIVTITILGTLFVSAMSAWVFFRESSRLEVLFRDLENISLFLSGFGIKTKSDTNLYLTYGIYRTFSNISTAIYHFPPFFEVYKPHPLMGGYQFSFIAQRFPNADWFAWKNEVEDSYRYFGMFWNVWGTFVRDYVIDFGWIGAPIASYLSGFFIGRLEVRYLRSPFLLSLYILSLVWLVMSIFYSALLIRYFHIAIILLIVCQFLIKQNPRKINKAWEKSIKGRF